MDFAACSVYACLLSSGFRSRCVTHCESVLYYAGSNEGVSFSNRWKSKTSTTCSPTNTSASSSTKLCRSFRWPSSQFRYIICYRNCKTQWYIVRDATFNFSSTDEATAPYFFVLLIWTPPVLSDICAQMCQRLHRRSGPAHLDGQGHNIYSGFYFWWVKNKQIAKVRRKQTRWLWKCWNLATWWVKVAHVRFFLYPDIAWDVHKLLCRYYGMGGRAARPNRKRLCFQRNFAPL